MDYTFIAIMRSGEKVMIAQWSDIEFFRRMMTNFDASDNIASFAIYKGDTLIEEKVLPMESKSLIRRK